MPLADLADQLARLDASSAMYAQEVAGLVLNLAIELDASDLHIQPTATHYVVRARLDGVLHAVAEIPRGEKTDLVARLKVLSGLLTYRTDLPQEGRIQEPPVGYELRVSTFPVLHGERVVVRLFRHETHYHTPDQLGLPETVLAGLVENLQETSGLILITGPAGSGKSTTSYACLRHLAAETAGARSIVTLEDPIEIEIPGISQSQIHPPSGFDFPTGLRSLLRQDPEVILVGEIRDRTTAEIAMQASLTGQLVLSTFHAGSAAEAISRLIEMEIPPYVVSSGLLAVLHQRLVRKLCDCATPCVDKQGLGFDLAGLKAPAGCERCQNTGYRGRIPLVEYLVPAQHGLNLAQLQATDSRSIQEQAARHGMTNRWTTARQLLESGQTSPAEIRRVLGFGE